MLAAKVQVQKIAEDASGVSRTNMNAKQRLVFVGSVIVQGRFNRVPQNKQAYGD